jgi:hypothetical protein
MNGMGKANTPAQRKWPHKPMPWEQIINLPECKLIKPLNTCSELVLLRNPDDTHWLVGRYRDMTEFAAVLRFDAALRDVLSANRVRLGLRNTDVPPTEIARQKCYGVMVQGETYSKDFAASRLNPMARPVQALEPISINRITDCAGNVKRFWASQTPQSHHVVEFNNLETLGVSRKSGNNGMDYFQLPSVLLAAEFHQRYISAVLKPTHHWNKLRLAAEMPAVYSGLYLERSKLFESLWAVANAILSRAGLVAIL